MNTKSYPASLHLPTPEEIRRQKETGCRTPGQTGDHEDCATAGDAASPDLPAHPVPDEAIPEKAAS